MAEVVKSETRRRIVVAVVESEESTYALRWFLRNLLRAVPAEGSEAGDTLILVYARPSPRVHPAMDGAGRTSETGFLLCDVDQVKVDAKVCIGDPRDVICQVVEKLGADLLVIGSHGYGFIKRSFLGSVSDHCARNAKCPVLIVKRQAK
ncbi:hypothetical protein GW17_00011728 [Ensete ventricosum]|nr:hypothetical protein GW17_00011728 [Ensete ventricosum]